jgi:hypothetical protein
MEGFSAVLSVGSTRPFPPDKHDKLDYLGGMIHVQSTWKLRRQKYIGCIISTTTYSFQEI